MVLGGTKTITCPHSPARILQVYREALAGFSDVLHPEGLSLGEFSQDRAHQNGPAVGTGDRMYIWGEGGPSHCSGPGHRSNYSHTPWMTSSKRFQELKNQGAELTCYRS